MVLGSFHRQAELDIEGVGLYLKTVMKLLIGARIEDGLAWITKAKISKVNPIIY
jgi:hypothetical protein